MKVADDLYVIQNQNHTVPEIGTNGGNVTIIVTSDGVVLVDSKNEPMHDDILAKVKSVTDKPVRYLVLTHNHGDHTGGFRTSPSAGRDGRFVPGFAREHGSDQCTWSRARWPTPATPS